MKYYKNHQLKNQQRKAFARTANADTVLPKSPSAPADGAANRVDPMTWRPQVGTGVEEKHCASKDAWMSLDHTLFEVPCICVAWLSFSLHHTNWFHAIWFVINKILKGQQKTNEVFQFNNFSKMPHKPTQSTSSVSLLQTQHTRGLDVIWFIRYPGHRRKAKMRWPTVALMTWPVTKQWSKILLQAINLSVKWSLQVKSPLGTSACLTWLYQTYLCFLGALQEHGGTAHMNDVEKAQVIGKVERQTGPINKIHSRNV